MPFKGSDFLDAARLLAGEGGNEACERSAVSRAYYSSFHQARDYCVTQGWPIGSGPDVHRQIRGHLQEAARRAPNARIQRQYQSVERNLHRLRLWRNQADYDIPLPKSVNLTTQVQLAISLAETVIHTVNSLPR